MTLNPYLEMFSNAASNLCRIYRNTEVINLVTFCSQFIEVLMLKRINEAGIRLNSFCNNKLFSLFGSLYYSRKERKQNMPQFTENSRTVIHLWSLYLFTENNVKRVQLLVFPTLLIVETLILRNKKARKQKGEQKYVQ